MEMEQGDVELAFGDVELGDGVLLFLAVSSSKPCSSIGGSLLVNLVCDRTCLLVLTEHVRTARLASCHEHAKSILWSPQG